MKILLAASMALLMTGASFAADSDNPNYLNGPNIQRFYTDDTMTTMRPEAEIKVMWDEMTEEDRASLSTACEANQDPKHAELCLSMRNN